MRVNSRRLQPFGEDPLGRRCTESPTWKSGPKPSNGQHVSRNLSIFDMLFGKTCNIVSIDSEYVLFSIYLYLLSLASTVGKDPFLDHTKAVIAATPTSRHNKAYVTPLLMQA